MSETKVSRSKAMLAKCHDCQGHYVDGMENRDCRVITCPLYPFMPYAERIPDLEWTKYNPKRVGKVLTEDSKRVMTPEQRAAAAERLSRARDVRKLLEEDAVEDLDDDETDADGDE